MLETINVTVKTVQHPNQQQAIDVFAQIITKEILKQERGSTENRSGGR